MNVICIDFEVFKHDWILVACVPQEQRFIRLHNDAKGLEDFYNRYRNDVFAGYNIKRYDQYIFKGIMLGYNPFDISKWIIQLHLDGWRFSKDINCIPMNVYEIQFDRTKGLKYYEAAMGHDIYETSVPFDLDRRLTEQELQETFRYCENDVCETVRVLIERKDDFEAHMNLIRMFDVPLRFVKKTKVQLSALILGATVSLDNAEIERRKADEFAIDFPSTLKLGKYECARKWYENASNRDYSLGFDMKVAQVPHSFGWGGVHGSIDRYSTQGKLLMFDVASLYPSLMIRYNLLSRYADMERFTDIVNKRLEYKKAKNPLQAPLKIVVNGTYGAMKDKTNALYDPLQANRVCVYGQLLLVDLIEKVEKYGLIVNSNTDGVLIRLWNESCRQPVLDACEEWQERTGLSLDFKNYTRIYQANVNNYVLINDETGKVKTKGRTVKKSNALDCELAVIADAITARLIEGTPIEKTIGDCKELRRFQMIRRATAKFPTLSIDGKHTGLDTVRLFASTSGGALYKTHVKGRTAKVEGLPPSVRMINGDITEMKLPDWIDIDWYISEAYRLIESYEPNLIQKEN